MIKAVVSPKIKPIQRMNRKPLRLSHIDLSTIDISQDKPIGMKRACEVLNCSREMIIRWIKENGLPHWMKGRVYLFYEKLLLAWQVNQQQIIE